MSDLFENMGPDPSENFDMGARQRAIDAFLAERDADVIETPQAPAPTMNPFANPMVMLNMALLGKADEALARGAAINQQDMQRMDRWRDSVMQANNYRALRRSKMNTTIAEMRLEAEREREAADTQAWEREFRIRNANAADDDRNAGLAMERERLNMQKDREARLEAERSDYRLWLRENPAVLERLVTFRQHLSRMEQGMLWNPATQSYQTTKGMSAEQITLLKAGMEDEVAKIGAIVGTLFPKAEDELRKEYGLYNDAFDKVEQEMGGTDGMARETYGDPGDPARFDDPNYQPTNATERRLFGQRQRDLNMNQAGVSATPNPQGIDTATDLNAFQELLDATAIRGTQIQQTVEQRIEAGQMPTGREVRDLRLPTLKNVITQKVRSSEKWEHSDAGDAEIKQFARDLLMQWSEVDSPDTTWESVREAARNVLVKEMGISAEAADRALKFAKTPWEKAERDRTRQFRLDLMAKP